MNPKWDIFRSDAVSEAALVACTFSVGSSIHYGCHVGESV
jgi:hypothetical protein